MSDTLFDVLTVHCFWGWCNHVVRGVDPDANHTEMEAHYAAKHPAETRAVVTWLGRGV